LVGVFRPYHMEISTPHPSSKKDPEARRMPYPGN